MWEMLDLGTGARAAVLRARGTETAQPESLDSSFIRYSEYKSHKQHRSKFQFDIYFGNVQTSKGLEVFFLTKAEGGRFQMSSQVKFTNKTTTKH